jgi:hypothetical protein
MCGVVGCLFPDCACCVHCQVVRFNYCRRCLPVKKKNCFACSRNELGLCYIIHKSCVNNTTNKYLQPCTKYVPIMHRLHINFDSSICTNIIKYTPHVCANSSTTCLNHVPNMYLNHIPNTYTNITIKISLAIHHTIHNHIP